MRNNHCLNMRVIHIFSNRYKWSHIEGIKQLFCFISFFRVNIIVRIIRYEPCGKGFPVRAGDAV